MTVIDKIESSLTSATSIRFFPTEDYEREPPVIILMFDKPNEGAEGYDLLIDHFEGKSGTLVIFQNEDKIDISLVLKNTADAVNIKNLNFDSSQLADFLRREPKDRQFVFAIGFVTNGQPTITMTRQPFSPVLLDKFEFK